MVRTQWDKDLRGQRFILWAVAALNAITMGTALWHRQWIYAAVGLIWTLDVLVMLRLTRSLQKSRDEARIILAVIAGMKEKTN